MYSVVGLLHRFMAIWSASVYAYPIFISHLGIVLCYLLSVSLYAGLLLFDMHLFTHVRFSYLIIVLFSLLGFPLRVVRRVYDCMPVASYLRFISVYASIDSLSFYDLYFSDFISFCHQRFAMVYRSLTCVCIRFLFSRRELFYEICFSAVSFTFYFI